jgi:hypothetical protein
MSVSPPFNNICGVEKAEYENVFSSLFDSVFPVRFLSLFFFFPNQKLLFKMERTYVMVKPDGVQRGLVGEILKRFEQRGYQLLALELIHPTKERLEEHVRRFFQ